MDRNNSGDDEELDYSGIAEHLNEPQPSEEIRPPTLGEQNHTIRTICLVASILFLWYARENVDIAAGAICSYGVLVSTVDTSYTHITTVLNLFYLVLVLVFVEIVKMTWFKSELPVRFLNLELLGLCCLIAFVAFRRRHYRLSVLDREQNDLKQIINN